MQAGLLGVRISGRYGTRAEAHAERQGRERKASGHSLPWLEKKGPGRQASISVMTIVLLSSFKQHDATYLKQGTAYSIAVYQPKWLPQLPVTRVFDIRDANGSWIRPRDFMPEGHDPTLPSDELLKRYRDALLGLYVSRRKAIGEFLHDHEGHRLTLCCWCPYDKAAQRQLHDYGSFVCHSAVVQAYLEVAGVTVLRDLDRVDSMVCF